MSDWRKSTYSPAVNACVEWRKSSYSADTAACVETHLGEVVQVRDSKDKNSPILTFSPADWKRFLEII